MSRIVDHIRELDYCTYCPKLCTFACPVSEAENRESVTPWAKMTLANLLRKGHIPLTPENIEPLYHCLACRLCTHFCKHEIEVGQTLTDVREWLVESGVAGKERGRNLDSVQKAQQKAEKKALSSLKKLLPSQLLTDQTEVLYFPGTDAVLSRPGEIEATFSIFNELGIDFVGCYTGENQSSGLPFYWFGFEKEFKDHAKRLAEKLSHHKLIVTGCASTAYAFKILYDDMGLNIGRRVRHVLEFLNPYLENETFNRRLEGRVVYHDPSCLARYLGLRELPRRLLARMCDNPLVELVWNGEGAYPSASTGVLPIIKPEVGGAIAMERYRQALEVRAEMIVTGDPISAARLAAVQNDNALDIMTMTEAIDYCLKKG